MDHGGQESTLNALIKSICPLVKQLDERRARAKSLGDLFDEDVAAWRQELVQSCEDAFFDDQDCVSAKPREIMWRKGYYDAISMAKRFIHKHQKSHAALDGLENNRRSPLDGMEQLRLFIEEGMLRLKKIIIRIEKDYNLDLKYIVDFTLFENGEMELPLEPQAIPINKKITSLEIINFALESIHALIVSLGDLHRYYLDFGLHLSGQEVTQQLTAQYYEEAFKLNPKNGMPQNQLGTLWIGRNFNLDSVYHYLYSLVSPKPFELSEDNVIKIFNGGAAYLEALLMDRDYHVNMQDFVARFLLIVDIFFFDKNVPTFNDLCRFLLCDLNAMLRQRKEDGGHVLDQDLLFKLTSILFFCMRKLRLANSPKVYQLNAFLAAICDQLAESCNANFEEFFAAHALDNEECQVRYQMAYSLYYGEKGNNRDEGERRNRMNSQELPGSERRKEEEGNGRKLSGLSGTSTTTTAEDAVSQGASSGSPTGRRIEHKLPLNVKAPAAGTAQSPPVGKKRVLKYRRRRRLSTYTSDSDLTSNFDSDSEKSEADEESDAFSDADSEDEEDFYSDADQENKAAIANGHGIRAADSPDGDEDSDVVIEEETVVMVNGKATEKNRHRLDTHFNSLSLVNDDEGGEEMAASAEMGAEKGEDRARHKMSQMKYDPNLLLQFVAEEPTIRALKVLFDWLMDNKEIIWECFQSNPEFVHKMMTVLNTVNVNIFTRRIFFDRSLLTVEGLRDDIRSLFDVRAKVPIGEDLRLKHFAEFVRAQEGLDWELAAQMQVTPMEENLLRVVKLKNFGFFICDRKKFGYAFRNCRFEEIDTEQAKKKKKNGKRDSGRHDQRGLNGWGSQGSGSGENRRERRRRQRKMMARNGEVIDDMDGNNNVSNGGRRRRGGGQNNGQTGSGNRNDDVGGGRQRQQPRRGRGAGEGNGDGREKEDIVSREREMLKKGELMGKLWLRNEVKNLESKARGPKGMGLLTPYVVVDTKALVQHLSIVKHFVSMKKFIVLIPSEVLAELDGLKVSHDRARECIRWLDRTISNGSQFLKTQELREKLAIRDYVKPRGMRTEASSFVEIAEFCHYLAKKYEIDGQSADVLTLLTGEDLAQKEALDCDYVGILRSIPIKFDRIDKFYGKLIKK